MALRIGLLRSSALQNDGFDAPVILQCRTPQGTNPKGHWGPHYFFIQSLFSLPPCTQSWYTQSPHQVSLNHAGYTDFRLNQWDVYQFAVPEEPTSVAFRMLPGSSGRDTWCVDAIEV